MHGFDYLVPHFITRVRGTRIVVTLDLISEVLHGPSIEFATTPTMSVLGMCPMANSRLAFVRHLLWVTVKTPLAQALQKV